MKPAEKYRAWKAHRPEKPIFRTILFSMMAVLLAEVILLSTGIGLTNVSGRLNQNAKQIVNMQVRNRASYLQDMLIRAQELTDISTTINNLTQQMLQDGTISLDTMDQSSEAADPLMEAAAPYLVSALRARPCTVNAEGDKVLTVVQGGRTRYIMLRVTTEDRVQVGLAEDVTAATQERLRIERERDYDILTGLYNRQAFHRVSHELFQNPERLGVAALLMMDLDDLKHINDTYGHDWGDHYIQNTGRCIAEHSPPGTVCARLSGDEFLLLFYGYPGREQLREKLEALTRAMQQAVVVLPSGSDLHISISGGVAWYPEDGRDIETLKKYADFAMYQVKHSTKGQMKDFDIGVYNQEAYIARTRREFHQLISEERMYYYFQPIFSAQTGRVHAYEALMRSDLPTLRSPATIMKLAREQGALYEIERLTFRKALEGFDKLRSKNLVDRQALIFINSIASVCLRREDSEYMDQRWHELRRQMVIEITEEEEMNREALEIKRHAPGFSGMFALDDYGSGYSNEGSLLELAPRFIKVDISIIRGIDSDPDKQQILRNVVRYAQPRNMQIIAEGVETAAEMRTVIDLGADLLQGYFLARPAAVPDPIAPEAAEIIRAIQDSNRRKRF